MSKEDNQLSPNEQRLLDAFNRSVETTIQNTFSEFDKRFGNIEHYLRESVGRQDSKLLELENDKRDLQEKVKELSREKDNLLLEIREKNLVFLGVTDEDNESAEILIRKVRSMIFEITKIHITPDVTYRIGEYHGEYSRPIRVKFKLLSERNMVFSNKRKVKQPRAIKADTPENIRRDHAILFGQQAELKDQGKDSIINFKRRTLQTTDGETFSVNDGVLLDPQNKPVIGVKRSGRTNGFGRGYKKPRLESNHFLGEKEGEKAMETDHQGNPPSPEII